MRTDAQRRLLFATRNPGKVREMQALLADLPWRVEPLPDDAPRYRETGSTFEENARGKALFHSRSTADPVLADDSGLVVDALGGEPGVLSARYIDPDLPQHERNQAVLRRLEGVEGEARSARFVCHLVLAHRGEVIQEATGYCEGLIAEAAGGEGGFGYDPIFRVPGLGRTFAELEMEEKSRRSHRGAAARAMAEFLADWRPP